MKNDPTIISEKVIEEWRNSHPIETLSQHKETIYTQRVLRERKDSLIEIHHGRVTGINNHSGKRYFRWEKPNFLVVKRTKGGHFVATTRTRDSGYTSQQFAVGMGHGYAQIESALLKKWGDEISVEKAMPLASHYLMEPMYDWDRYNAPNYVRDLVRCKDARELTIKVFGKKRVRKDLVKAVANANICAIVYASLFKQFVPVDWIIDFLRNQNMEEVNRTIIPYTELSRFELRSARVMLAHLHRRHHRRLLNERFRSSDVIIRLLKDSIRTFNANGAPIDGFDSIKSLGDLHDLLVWQTGAEFRYRRRMERADAEERIHLVNHRPARRGVQMENRPLTPDPLSAKIDGQVIKDYVVVTPTDTDTLRAWGDEMNNCIASYCNKNERTTLGAIYKDDNLIANFEITDGRLIQLLGKFNKSLNAESRNMFEPFFKAFNVKVDSYWGNG